MTTATTMAHPALNERETVIQELGLYDQFVGWRYEFIRGRRKKVPLNPRTGNRASTTAPETWASYEVAAAAAEQHGWDGVGYVFDETDPFGGVDLDGCREPETGEIAPWAWEIVLDLNSYTEVSPSGTGLKILIKAEKRGSRCRATIEGQEVEIYSRKQFFTITGRRVWGHRIETRQTKLDVLYNKLFPTPTVDATSCASPCDCFPSSDGELLETARNAPNGAKFRALYDDGSLSYHGSDHSRADLALMAMLAYHTRNDAERMESLFSESALGRRQKWKTRPDYRQRTISRAIEFARTNSTGRFEVQRSVIARLDRLEGWARTYPWSESRGGRNRHVFGALSDIARERGRPHPEGVEVTTSEREMCLEAGIGGRDSLDAALHDLEKNGRVLLLQRGEDDAASTFLLRVSPDQDHEGSGP